MANPPFREAWCIAARGTFSSRAKQVSRLGPEALSAGSLPYLGAACKPDPDARPCESQPDIPRTRLAGLRRPTGCRAVPQCVPRYPRRAYAALATMLTLDAARFFLRPACRRRAACGLRSRSKPSRHALESPRARFPAKCRSVSGGFRSAKGQASCTGRARRSTPPRRSCAATQGIGKRSSRRSRSARPGGRETRRNEPSKTRKADAYFLSACEAG